MPDRWRYSLDLLVERLNAVCEPVATSPDNPHHVFHGVYQGFAVTVTHDAEGRDLDWLTITDLDTDTMVYQLRWYTRSQPTFTITTWSKPASEKLDALRQLLLQIESTYHHGILTLMRNEHVAYGDFDDGTIDNIGLAITILHALGLSGDYPLRL
jgi:hypothetical protein